MRYIYWTYSKFIRLFVVLTTLLAYIILLLKTNEHFFTHLSTNTPTALFLTWLPFGFAAFVGLMFLTVTALIWLYARDRSVALALYCFSCCMMIAFATLNPEEGSIFGAINII